ncbi:MAG: hypothetical protein WA705_26290 [Candidatus Ozemobacteraceae bacterium]
MKTMPRIALALAFLLAVTNIDLAADMVVNPAYAKWAKFKVGTYVKYKKTVEANGKTTESELTKTLVEVSSSKAVIETAESISIVGKKTDVTKTRFEFPARIEKFTPMADRKQNLDVQISPQQSEEQITVAGEIIKCKTMTSSFDTGGAEKAFKTWTNENIPESLVKSDTTFGKPSHQHSVMLLIEKCIK